MILTPPAPRCGPRHQNNPAARTAGQLQLAKRFSLALTELKAQMTARGTEAAAAAANLHSWLSNAAWEHRGAPALSPVAAVFRLLVVSADVWHRLTCANVGAWASTAPARGRSIAPPAVGSALFGGGGRPPNERECVNMC